MGLGWLPGSPKDRDPEMLERSFSGAFHSRGCRIASAAPILFHDACGQRIARW